MGLSDVTIGGVEAIPAVDLVIVEFALLEQVWAGGLCVGSSIWLCAWTRLEPRHVLCLIWAYETSWGLKAGLSEVRIRTEAHHWAAARHLKRLTLRLYLLVPVMSETRLRRLHGCCR